MSKSDSLYKGIFILESVVAAHEIIHEIHRNKESGIILKLDYEKLTIGLAGLSLMTC